MFWTKFVDWAIELLKIGHDSEKDKPPSVTNNTNSTTVVIVQQPQPAPPSLGEKTLFAELLPPLPQSTPKPDPEFGSEDYLTELWKDGYRKKRPNEEFNIGFGTSDSSDAYEAKDNEQ